MLKARQLIQADLATASAALASGSFVELYQVTMLQGKIQGLNAALSAMDFAYQELEDSD